MPQLDKLRLSGITYDLIDETALHTLDNTVTSTGTNAVKGSGIYEAVTASTAALAEAIAEAGYQTSGDVQNAIGSLFGAVNYDSNTKRINFYHESTTGSVLAYIDATAFIKDGMVSNVEIVNGNLVITFNSDAGKEAITIPIADIFDASNYYTKAEVDTALSGKADTATTYTKTETDNLLANKANTATTYTKTEVDALLAGKNQVITVSGTTLIIS